MKKYSIRVLGGTVICLLSVFVFNYIINPYDIFESVQIEGVNTYKSEVGRHTRLSKAYQVERIDPESVLLASSRGLVVPDNYLSEVDVTGYNLSLTSASTYELYRMMQHAQANHALKRVVLALDESFTNSKRANFIETRLLLNPDGTTNTKKWLTHWRDIFSSLLSADALRASLRTLRKQKDDPVLTGYEKFRIKRVRSAGGHRQMFRNMEASIFSGSAKIAEDNCRYLQNNTVETDTVSSQYFSAIVDLAYRKDIDLYIFFSPVHARLYEVKCMTGKWGEMESMKRAVVNIVDNKALLYNGRPYPVWDFSGYNSVTTEAVPPAGDTESLMSGYYEGSHYTRKTAEMVFAKIFATGDVADDFGVLLAEDTLDAHLIDIREKRIQYVLTHGSDIRDLKMLQSGAVGSEK